MIVSWMMLIIRGIHFFLLFEKEYPFAHEDALSLYTYKLHTFVQHQWLLPGILSTLLVCTYPPLPAALFCRQPFGSIFFSLAPGFPQCVVILLCHLTGAQVCLLGSPPGHRSLNDERRGSLLLEDQWDVRGSRCLSPCPRSPYTVLPQEQAAPEPLVPPWQSLFIRSQCHQTSPGPTDLRQPHSPDSAVLVPWRRLSCMLPATHSASLTPAVPPASAALCCHREAEKLDCRVEGKHSV